ncbi:hypothetical protein SEA_EASTWEST_59 [Arthrobacter phage EastWest]|uniref:Uncharacterized protein n=1 Tax=Arthrobacter phage EastWest TaxID=2894292 RepID=A0AAE8YKI5_9CAUD|nr:hypothetical protein SEA_EASTWEST_59 [Arthrobacter phage EastWest]
MAKCAHPIETRSDDLATGDVFCGDCGDVMEAYANQPRRLAGDDAAEAIAKELAKDEINIAGSVTVYSVTPLGADEFDVNVRIMLTSGEERVKWRSFIVKRDGKKLTASMQTV